jgi:GNAT superfamily N-acetyltransferase
MEHEHLASPIQIRHSSVEDVPLILSFIRELAEYEGLLHDVVATEEQLRATLFGPKPAAEVVIAYEADQPVGFALFFHNYSTFLAQRGLYLEDLYVKPEARGKGVGKKLLLDLAQLAVDRGCGRMEWWVLDWNESAIQFYKNLGARPMDEWTVFRLTGDDLVRLGEEDDALRRSRIDIA